MMKFKIKMQLNDLERKYTKTSGDFQIENKKGWSKNIFFFQNPFFNIKTLSHGFQNVTPKFPVS